MENQLTRSAPPIAVRTFAGDATEWDSWVKRQPGWTHCHLFGWQRVIGRTLGHECLYIAAYMGTELVGVLPLIRVRSLLFGHYLVSVPFLNYGGALGSAAAVRALADHAVGLAASQNVKLLELRSRGEQALDLPVSHRKITTVVDVPEGGATALWSQLSSKMRTKIRRPQRDGAEVRFGADQVEPFHRVFAHNMRDLGTPTHGRAFFESIQATFGDSVWFACVYIDGRAVAGGCGLRWADEFEITWSSGLRSASHTRAVFLLHWAFMERAADDGARLHNFGRSTPGTGTHEFKQQWGGRDETLWWYQRARDGVSGTPSPDAGAYALGPRLWRKLPLSIASALGPHVVRLIP